MAHLAERANEHRPTAPIPFPEMNATKPDASGRIQPLAFRFGPSIVGLMAFGAMALLFCFGDRELYLAILRGWGILPIERPFLDTESILRAIACWRSGVDVWHPSPCMNGGWYSYSPLLLHAAVFDIGLDDRVAFGLPLVIVFLVSLSALPPSRSWSEVGVRSLAVLSAATVFAVERANLDVAVFLLTLAGVCLAARRDAWRFAGYGVFILAAVVKFYPAVLLLLVLRERTRIMAAVTAAAALAATILLFPSSGGAPEAVKLAPVGSPYSDLFGARNLPLGLIVLPAAPPDLPWDQVLRMPLPVPAMVMLGALTLAAGAVAWRNVRPDEAAWGLLSAQRAAALVAGAALIVGCFFAAQNIAYRAIFLLLTLPGLFALIRTEGDRRRSYALVIAGVLFCLWEEFFHHAATELQPAIAEIIRPEAADLVFWLVREAVWWWVIARLLSLLGAFILTCKTVISLRQRLLRTR
jgi:hypothetical protein